MDEDLSDQFFRFGAAFHVDEGGGAVVAHFEEDVAAQVGLDDRQAVVAGNDDAVADNLLDAGGLFAVALEALLQVVHDNGVVSQGDAAVFVQPVVAEWFSGKRHHGGAFFAAILLENIVDFQSFLCAKRR